jgi:hypothetical protein
MLYEILYNDDIKIIILLNTSVLSRLTTLVQLMGYFLIEGTPS